jgi:hypothetical protein
VTITNQIRSHRLSVRTPGFHPGKRSSILLGITTGILQIETTARISSLMLGHFFLSVNKFDSTMLFAMIRI